MRPRPEPNVCPGSSASGGADAAALLGGLVRTPGRPHHGVPIGQSVTAAEERRACLADQRVQVRLHAGRVGALPRAAHQHRRGRPARTGRTSYRVTTPTLPPPRRAAPSTGPRRRRRRSAPRRGAARFASTTSADTSRSHAMPCLWLSGPTRRPGRTRPRTPSGSRRGSPRGPGARECPPRRRRADGVGVGAVELLGDRVGRPRGARGHRSGGAAAAGPVGPGRGGPGAARPSAASASRHPGAFLARRPPGVRHERRDLRKLPRVLGRLPGRGGRGSRVSGRSAKHRKCAGIHQPDCARSAVEWLRAITQMRA
jgi:hypothetical protein